MLQGISIQNIRSFGNEPQTTKLDRLNIFVGKNSCGKSTFLRIFPLLRQSIEADTLSPILWFGNYVDFGDIKTVKNNRSQVDEKVTFNFQVVIDRDRLLQKDIFYSLDFYENLQPLESMLASIIKSLPKTLLCQIGLSVHDEKLISMVCHIPALNCQLNIDYSGTDIKKYEISYNEYKEELSKHFTNTRSRNGLLPSILYSAIQNDDKKRIIRNTVPFFFNCLKVEISKQYKNSSKNLVKQISKLSFHPNEHKLKEILCTTFISQQKAIKHINSGANVPQKVGTYLFGMLTEFILEEVDQEITSYFKNIRYIGPLRANSDRYYRYQGLQVRELDHTGSNLPMVLQSLSPYQREKLNLWIKENLEFEIQLVTKDFHYMIEIKSKDDDSFHNITDMGFGYSQILPILVSIWIENNFNQQAFRRKNQNKIFVIEQPELHLHPALQYQFGQMVCKLIQHFSNVNFVIETHSKPIIDAVSDAINNKILKNNEVIINLFQKSASSHLTTITEAKFDEEGYLLDWPVGFLSAGDI